MVARTHDLGALTALNIFFIVMPIQQMTLATAMVCFGANFIGGLAPDLDDQSSRLWKRMRGGSIWSRIFTPLLGGHRLISHSLLGMAIAGGLAHLFLNLISDILLVNMYYVWWSFMIGMGSHLLLDSFTRQGIPLFFPIPIRLGIPPIKKFRIRTGGLFEKAVVFPILLAINLYAIYAFYPKYLQFITTLLGLS